jgi:DNA-binding CsgD family transcriptional regulator
MAIDPRELRRLARSVLTPRQFECWELVCFHHRSFRQVGVMLDRDESTVRRHVKRAESKLVRAVEDNARRGNLRSSAVRPGRARKGAGQGLAA